MGAYPPTTTADYYYYLPLYELDLKIRLWYKIVAGTRRNYGYD